MRRAKNVIILAIAAIVTVMTVAGCGGKKTDEELITERIESFVEAYNNGDMEEAIECMDSKSRNALESAMNMANALIGKTGFDISMGDLFGLAVSMSESELLKIDDISITYISDENADVSAGLSYNDKITGTANFEEQIIIKMKKEKSDWFIEDMG